jgi:uncharacterized protein (TIGR02246 family)
MTVQDVLDAQVAAWNRGDIGAFCSYCAEDVVYVGALGGLKQGRGPVEARYVAAYPDRSAMGMLSLDVLTFEERGDTAIAVVRWALKAASDRAGHALLVFRNGSEGWRLAYDATV